MRTIESPVKYFSGTVELPDFLTIPQCRAFEDALGDPNDVTAESDKQKKVWLSIGDEKMLPAVLACTGAWNINHITGKPTIDGFPATPRKASHDLILWLFNEIEKLWLLEDVPNG